jgi:hypothetical protein
LATVIEGVRRVVAGGDGVVEGVAALLITLLFEE